MVSRTCLKIFLVVFTSFLLSTEAYVFSVGGRDGWVVRPSEGYDSWAQRNRFLINDTLVFRYNNATDSVLVVNRQDYDSCSVSNPILRLDGGDSRFVFDRSGPFYFITGNQSNCQGGQKLDIVVLSPRTGTPPTTPTPTSPPIVAPASPPGTAPTPSSPPVVAPASPPPGTAPTPSSPPVVAPASPPPGNAPTPSSPPVVAPASPPGTAPTPSSPPVVAPASPPGTAPSPSSPPIVAPASPPGTAPSPSTIPVTTPSSSPSAASIPPGAVSPGGTGTVPGGSSAPGESSSDTTPPPPSSSPVLSSSKVFTIGFSVLVTLVLGSSLGF